ncbi:type II toxin-antitoxin system VapC family toxin [Pseudanabaena sp. UWO310]|uniref:type II toxin-antitoxin system VapC family toxin n=1 Tax=Pseudanabaena sp. UWO310 TaxID=2480795 RepID=UPI001157CDB8|nr:PIN domain-containing protein [Pseudanabaena sp. UWO310]TYQ27295.1 PIN domain-containing protein [Pseudanabaena sp. UWO310]
MIRVIADTGAIIALLDEDDKHHTAVVEVAQSFDLLIPVTVLPEVDYLVTKYLGEAVVRSFLEAMTEGEFIYLPIEIEEIRRTTEIMARYSDIPIGFVDASLVALAESHNIHRILTLDRRHFNIIRPEGIDYLELLP